LTVFIFDAAVNCLQEVERRILTTKYYRQAKSTKHYIL